MARSLVRKLCLKPNSRLLVLNAPNGYLDELAPVPGDVELQTAGRGPFDLVQVFVRSRGELADTVGKAMSVVRRGGSLWVSIPRDDLGSDLTLIDGVCRPLEGEGWQPLYQLAVAPRWAAVAFKQRRERSVRT